MAASYEPFAGGACSVRNVPRHLRVSPDRRSDGSAGAAIEESERAELTVKSSESRERLQRLLVRFNDNLRRRPSFPSRQCAELATFASTRSALGHANDNNLPWYQGN